MPVVTPSRPSSATSSSASSSSSRWPTPNRIQWANSQTCSALIFRGQKISIGDLVDRLHMWRDLEAASLLEVYETGRKASLLKWTEIGKTEMLHYVWLKNIINCWLDVLFSPSPAINARNQHWLCTQFIAAYSILGTLPLSPSALTSPPKPTRRMALVSENDNPRVTWAAVDLNSWKLESRSLTDLSTKLALPTPDPQLALSSSQINHALGSILQDDIWAVVESESGTQEPFPELFVRHTPSRLGQSRNVRIGE